MLQNNVKYSDILSCIDGIGEGDILYVVSDVLRLAKFVRATGEAFNIDCFIDSIIDKVGESGTVLIPTFNWDFCRGKVFDINKTPSQTGALGNAALRRKDFQRTKHPIYSFAVHGRDSEKLVAMNNQNSFGEGSVFDYLYQNKAKALVIDLTALAGLTFLHHVEQVIGVPYRYEKIFRGKYIDIDGAESEREYSMYVRDLDINPKARDDGKFSYLSDVLEGLNISRTTYYNGIPFRVVLIEGVYTIIASDIKYNEARNLYEY